MNNIITLNKPIRIRSKYCVLLYQNCSIDIIHLKKFLKKRFRIESDLKWEYLFKCEKLPDRTNILVFLTFKNLPDVYSNKLTLHDIDLEPSIWCFCDKTFPLYSLLKFYSKTEFEENVETNISQTELSKYVTIYEFSEPTQTVGMSKLKVEKKTSKPLRPIGDKQIKTIKKHMSEIDTLMLARTQNFTRLKTLRQNIVNFRNNYVITPGLDDQMNHYWSLVTTYTSPKNPKNQAKLYVKNVF